MSATVQAGQSAPFAVGRDPFLALASRSDDLSTKYRIWGRPLDSERDPTIHNQTGGFIHGELTLSRIASVVVGILGAGSSNTQTQPRAKTAKRMSRGAPSDGKVRPGTTTGRCKFPALLVLTLRVRLVRVAFGL